MRRVALYGLGWLAAAAVAVLLAWQGVGRVGTNVTDRHAAPLSAEQARRQLERTTATGTGAEPDGGSATTPPASDGQGGPPGTSPSTTATTRPAGASTTTTAGRASTSTTAGTAAPTSPPPSSAAETRTYNLVGGSVALRFTPSGVTVLWADPNPGFQADIDHGGGRVRVRFESDSHRSQVEAWWDGGPRDEIREDPDDGGSGLG